MLSSRILKDPVESYLIVENLNQQTETLIVSDLRAKRDAQDILIARDGYCLDDSVMRVSEFWKIWIRRLAPYMQFVDESVLKASVKKYLSADSMQIRLTDQEIDSALNFLWKAFPFVLQNEHQGVVSEWIVEQEKETGKEIYWKKWFRINQLCVDFILNQMRCLHPSWSAHFFSTLDVSKVMWRKNLIIDLAAEMTSVEFGLFESLSSRLNVQVIVPPVQLFEKYKSIRKLYDRLPGIKNAHGSIKNEGLKSADQIKRFSSSLSEIKFVSAQIRSWIDTGAAPEDIVIASPQIDSYWPILCFHLEHEKVPYDFFQPNRLADTELYQAFRSRLKVIAENISWAAIEQTAIVSPMTSFKMKSQYEQFKQRFFEATEAEELELHSDWIAELKLPIYKGQPISRTEYARILVSEFLKLNNAVSEDESVTEWNTNSFIRALKDYLSNTLNAEFPLKTWNEIFLSIVDRLDFSNQEEPLHAVRVRELNAALTLPMQYRIIFGCDQKALAGRHLSMIPDGDLKILKNSLDFDVYDGEESHQEFYLNALVEFPAQHQFVTTSLVGLNGEMFETPAILLKQNLHPDSGFDERGILYQKQKTLFLDKHEEVDELRKKYKNRFLTSDSSLVQDPMLNLNVSHFSATSLSDFKKCKFRFFAGHLVRVRTPEVDSIEVGPLKSGRILHKIFDFLSQQQFQTTGLDNMLEQLRTESRIYIGQDLLWNSMKARLTRRSAFRSYPSNTVHISRCRASDCRAGRWTSRTSCSQPFGAGGSS